VPALVLVRVDHRSSMAGNNGGMTSACHVPDEQLARFAATVSSADPQLPNVGGPILA